MIMACNGERSQQELISDIEEIEEEIGNDKSYDREHYQKAVNMITTYLRKFPGDTAHTPRYISRAVKYYGQMGQFDTADYAPAFFDSAFLWIDTLAIRYPDHEATPVMQFYKGTLYEQGVRDNEKAERAYLQFIDKYGSHELVQDALFSLEHLGRSDEEIYQEIMKRRDTTAVP